MATRSARLIGPALVLVLVLAAMTPAQASALAPMVKLAPPVGPPTTVIVVDGRGFGASERVDIRFDATSAGRARTDPAGGFSSSVTVPASALPGAHSVTARGRISHLSARATFRVRTDWPQFHFDPAHSGFNPYENVLDPSNVPGLALAWKSPVAPVDPYLNASVAVVGGRAYAGGGRLLSFLTYVSAFDAATGEVVWRTPFADEASARGVAVADGRVFVPTLLGHALHALDADTGTPLWTFQALGAMSEPTVADGVVYSGTNTNQFYAIDETTGDQVWSVGVGGDITGAPAAADGTVYFGSWDNNLYAVDALTGEFRWTFSTGDDISSSPAVADGVVYVGSDDHNLYAIDAATGGLLWSSPTGDAIQSSPTVAHGVVYVGSDDAIVYAFDTSTGAILWETALGGGVFESPSVANGVVYVGSLDHLFYALDSDTGEVLWSYLTNGVIGNGAAIVDGTVYTGSQDGYVYAFGLP